jgi:voltage-gated potassium channel
MSKPADASFGHLLHELYRGTSSRAATFRFCLLAFDLATIAFFILTSLLEPGWMVYAIDGVVAVVITADLLARFSIEADKRAWLGRLDSWLDMVVILSLAATFFIDNVSFLRVIRTLRLLRSYHVMRDLRKHWPWFKAHQDVVESSFNLFVFVYVVTALVFVTQHGHNPDIRHYIDALYFTVTTLTTTGFGDITMKDTSGRLLSVIIMIIGVSLFLRLVQTIFRPSKVLFRCPDCGLLRHDHDAVHCKHCGRVLPIDSSGLD